MSEARARATIEAYRCPSCDETYDQPGDAVYECSRCGSTQVDERRCSDCNIFMAKVADQSCPSCEEPIEEEPEMLTLWVANDGTSHESDVEAAAWEAGADDRAAAKVKADAETAAQMEAYRVEREQERAVIIEAWGRLRPLLTRPDFADPIGRSIGYESATVNIEVNPFILEFLPGEVEPTTDYEVDGSYEAHRMWLAACAERIAERYPMWGAPVHCWWECTSFSYDVHEALAVLLSMRSEGPS